MVSADQFLEAAIEEARQGLQEGGIPIGSVVVHRDMIIGRGHNRRVQRGNAILHGEMDALENAGATACLRLSRVRSFHDTFAVLNVLRGHSLV